MLKERVKKMIRARMLDGEIYYALKFSDTTRDSAWLTKRKFSPGNWAMSYIGLYLLYRTIEAMKPTTILEMGLGETTRITGQYAHTFNVVHYVIEHDLEWQKFFITSDVDYLDNSIVINKELEKTNYLDYKGITIYSNFYSVPISSTKFELIVVDGPFGSDGISRIDVLNLLENNLADNFSIIIDDTERDGERRLINEIKKVLELNGTEFYIGEYYTNKKTTIITSRKYKFLTTIH